MTNTCDGQKLAISAGKEEGYPVVTVSGGIDLYTASRFHEALNAACKGASALIVDLSEASHIDSAGLSALLLIYKRLSGRGAKLYVIAPPGNPGVRRVMEVTRLDSLISIRSTIDDVLKELCAQKAA